MMAEPTSAPETLEAVWGCTHLNIDLYNWIYRTMDGEQFLAEGEGE